MAEDWREEGFFLTEDNYAERMEKEVEPFIKENVQQQTITSYDGAQLRAYYVVNPQEKAAIVISHGFCEFFGKYQEMVWYFYQAGYSVFFVEYRGHGHSQRFTDDLSKVHLEKGFEEYVGDLKTLVSKVVVPNSTSGKYYLFAHSMGGAIGTMFLETYPKIFTRAVLSSPMLEANYAGLPIQSVKALMAIGKLLHWSEKWAPAQKPFDPEPDFENACSQSEARYNYVLNLRLQDSQCRNNGGTFGWAGGAVHSASFIRKKASTVKIPVLLLQAGKDTLVKLEAQDEFIKLAGNVKKIYFPDSKHEIWNGTDENVRQFYTETLDFFEAEQ